jgi:hypothetical protein
MIGRMDFLRLADKEKIRDIGSSSISAVSLTDGDARELALQTQENDLRLASEIELACGIEGIQNVFICDFDGRDSGVTGLLDSAESKVGLHSDSYPLRNNSVVAEREQTRYRAELYTVPGRMFIHKLICFENLLRCHSLDVAHSPENISVYSVTLPH